MSFIIYVECVKECSREQPRKNALKITVDAHKAQLTHAPRGEKVLLALSVRTT